MKEIKTILNIMAPELSKKQYDKLNNTLTSILLLNKGDYNDKYLLNLYKEHCEYKNLCESSIGEIMGVMNHFSSNTKTPMAELNHSQIKEYLVNYKNRGVSAKTLNHKISIINTFYDFLVKEELLEHNPMNKIERLKEPKRKTPSFSEEDVKELRKCCRCDRDRALLECLLSTGCRVSEVTRIKIKDIDFDNSTIFINQGKGKKDRTVVFDKNTKKYILKYLKTRSYNTDSNLFTKQNTHNEVTEIPITIGAVKNWFKYASKQCNIKDCHPHMCRHYCITNLIRKGMPIKLVQLQAGHASISTTMDVYNNQSVDELIESYKNMDRKGSK